MFKKISHPVHKVYHFLGGLFFPAVYYFLPSKKIVLIVFLALAIIFSLIEVLRFSSSRAKKVMGQKLGKASILFKKELRLNNAPLIEDVFRMNNLLNVGDEIIWFFKIVKHGNTGDYFGLTRG